MTSFNADSRTLSSVITLTPVDGRTKLQVPESNRTFFWVGGRMLSYDVPNKNGLVFFQEDCEKVLPTLQSSLANIAHIKPGNDVHDPYGLSNAVCGAISTYHSDSEGIDIIVKNDRAAVNSMGFREEDFQPGVGRFSAFSQESDFTPSECPWITVPPNKVSKITPTDVVDTYDYDTGKAMGLKSSFFDASSGSWKYSRDPKGNIVFVNLKPASFAGVGQVMRPADETAQIYTYAASVEGEKVISSLYPRVEQEQATAQPGRELSQIIEEPSPNMDAKDLTPALNAEIEGLKEKARALSTEKDTVAQERDAAKAESERLSREFSEFKTAQESLVGELKGQIETLTSTVTEKDGLLQEHSKKALSQERLALLEAVHPFSDEEKTEDFVKSLSEVSPDRLETLLVRRELVKAQADAKKSRSMSQVNDGGFSMSPVPSFNGQEIDVSKLTPASIF